MNKPFSYIIAVVVITGIGLYIGTVSNGRILESQPIRIGLLLPLTGLYAENGEHSQNGYLLAQDTINKNGGIHGRLVELVVQSHQGDDVPGAVSAYHSLVARGVSIVLGPNHTNTGLAIAPIACKDGTLLVSPSIGGTGFAPTCDTVFTFWPTDFNNSRTLGKTVVEDGAQRIAIVGSVQPWEHEQAEAVLMGVTEAGGTIVHTEITDNQAHNYATEVARIQQSKPDAVVFTNYGYMHIVASKLREYGSTARFYVVLLDDTRVEDARGAFEDATVITSITTSQWFKEQYQETFQREPGYPADLSYDVLTVLAKVMGDTRSTEPEQLARQLLELGEYDGASGLFTVVPTGDVVKEPVYQTVKNNVLIELSS